MIDGRKILMLSLAPKRLLNKDPHLMLFYKNIKSLVLEFIAILSSGRLTKDMNKIEKIFTGLNESVGDFLYLTAKDVFLLTKFFHSSIGPRKGNFFEELIEIWLKEAGYKVSRNQILHKALTTVLECEEIESLRKTVGKSKIDFVIRKNELLVLCELRMSEDTGGRTGQESLMDKFDKFLKSLESEDLTTVLRRSGIAKVDLVIATIFSENDRTVVKSPNAGRLNSLIGYIKQEEHLFGKIRELINKGAKLGIKLEEIGVTLKENRNLNFYYEGIDFSVRLLYGDDFFLAYFNGKSLEDLVRGMVIPDDIWLLYTIALNEIRRAKLVDTGKTVVQEIYEAMMRNGNKRKHFEDFANILEACVDLNDFVDSLDKLTDELRNAILETYERAGKALYVLETTDVSKISRYIKYLSYCLLVVHLSKEKRGDSID